MRTKQILLILVVNFLIFNQHCFAQEQVTVMTVTNNRGTDHPKLGHWRAAGVSLTGRQDTYISIISEPARGQVKRVVLIAAGQQSDNPTSSDGITTGNYGDGYTNVLTGQPNNYKQGVRLTNNLEATRTLNSLSLASKLINSGKFPKESTLFVLAFDARFGYFRDGSEKDRRENAFYNFITSKFDASKVELIVLSGQSRGGALMFRLGSRLRRSPTYSKIPLIVQGYDPVATNPILVKTNNILNIGQAILRNTPIEQYLPIYSKNDILRNPNDYNNKYCWKVDMDVTFPPDKRENLLVYNLHSGGKVGLHNSIRAFAWKEQNTDLGWYKQHWLNFGHEEMGGCNYFNNSDCLFKTVESGYQHIIYGMDKIIKEKVIYHKPKQRYPVDINGDGLSDVVMRVRNGNSNQLAIQSAISNGDGTFTSKSHLTNLPTSTDKYTMLSGYFDESNKSDLLFMHKLPNQSRMNLITLLSNGDGTFTKKQQTLLTMGNMHAPLVGDVNGDGLTDLIVRNQSKVDGLVLVTYLCNGDGTFTIKPFKGGDGAGIDNGNMHTADVNHDKKTDLVYWWQGDMGLQIRTRISNGDGTFKYRSFNSNLWVNMNNVQSHVGDFNRDRKSDLIFVDRDGNSGILKILTFVSQGDGNYVRFIQELDDGLEVDKLASVIGDFNGDYRTDILFRSRDSQGALVAHVYYANSDNSNTYIKETQSLGDGAAVDRIDALTGNYNARRATDLLLSFHAASELEIRPKLKNRTGEFIHKSAKPFSRFDRIISLNTRLRPNHAGSYAISPILSGPVYWNGGATFNPSGPSQPIIKEEMKVKVPGIKTKQIKKTKVNSNSSIRSNKQSIKGNVSKLKIKQ